MITMKRHLLLLLLALSFVPIKAAFGETKQGLIVQADAAYSKDNYLEAFSFYKKAQGAGPLDAMSWYHFAFSYENLSATSGDVSKLYAVARHELAIELPDSIYLQYATGKLTKLGAQTYIDVDDKRIDELKNDIKLFAVPKAYRIAHISPLAYIGFLVGIVVLLALTSKLQNHKYVAFGVFPLLSIACSWLVSGAPMVLRFPIVASLIMCYVIISGGFLHATKSGRADRRYNYNPFVHRFSDGARTAAKWGILGNAIVGLPLYLIFMP